jgi:small conductance mechanosensitive channel
MAVVLLLGLLAQQVLRYATHKVKRHLTRTGDGSRTERMQRANSLATVLTASLSVIIWLVVGLSILQQLGIDVGPFLASAGIIGLAFSFGSQELVKDVIAGIFFLLENQFNTGNSIQVSDKKGVVISMSLRTITLKDIETEAVYIIRNSQVGIVTRFADEPAKEK